MKKLFLFCTMLMALLLAGTGQVSAQEQLTVHNGTGNSRYVPVYGYYAENYNKTEMVYPATELSVMADANINSLTFYTSTKASGLWGATYQVFIKEVDYTTIGSYSGVEDATIVYEGALDGRGDEMKIDFNTPYYYNGGNLLVGIYEIVTGSWKDVYWYGETVSGASIQGNSADGLANCAANQRNFLPKTSFAFTPSLEWNAEANAYEIATADDLYYFATLVNGGITNINAILTADIEVNQNVLLADGSLNEDEADNFKVWTPIGTRSKPFCGTFDGNGHTVSGLYFHNTTDGYYPNGGNYVGLIGATSGATIKNVGVIDSYLRGCYNVGGILGYSDVSSSITNCFNASTIVVEEDCAGGICGYNGGCAITNCFNTGKVDGSSSYIGGIVGQRNGTTTNNYVLEGSVSSANGGTFATTEQFANGYVAYQINENAGNLIYYQTIGSDGIPTLDDSHAVVIASAEGGYESHFHELDENGFCSCGKVFAEPEFNGTAYEIANAGNLYWFAKYVNSGNNSANAILTANIVVNTGVLDANGALNGDLDDNNFKVWTPIGTRSKPFCGTFDGNGHTVSGLYFHNTNDGYYPNGGNYVGLIGACSGATIKNVGVIDSYLRGCYNVGGILGYSDVSSSITNCFNTSTIIATSSVGGIAGYNGGCAITNCFNTGKVDGSSSYIGGIVGQRNGTTTNNYVLEGSVSSANGGTFATAAQFASGYVACKINQNAEDLIYYQTLDEDAIPTLNSNHSEVYTSLPCMTVFSNNPDDVSEKEHVFVNGICTACGEPDKATWNKEDEVYEIANQYQLYWFAEFVNSGEGSNANAVLTADIVVNQNVLLEDGSLNEDEADNFKAWTPIGMYYDKPYSGNFDGNGHTISGLYSCIYDEDAVGLFGFVGDGRIANVGVIDSYFFSMASGSICGYLNGGYITNCYAASYASGMDSGGICGIYTNGSITNCFNIGKIEGDYEGGIVGYVYGSELYIGNCYYLTGSVDGYGIGYFNGNVSEKDARGVTAATAEQFKSGYVASKINYYADGLIYYQTLGEDTIPTLDSEHGWVYASWPCVSEFSNSRNGVSEKEHVFVNGICTACGEHEQATWSDDANAYLIANQYQLYWFADYVNSGRGTNANAILTADIVVNENVLNEDGELNEEEADNFKEWTPIGDFDNGYSGHFNGNGHTVSGLFTNLTDSYSPAGLFGYVTEGEIRNAGVIDSYFNSYYSGGVCGYLEEGAIAYSYSTSAVYGDFSAGGICGSSEDGAIYFCYSASTVNGDYAGGVCGYSEENYIASCFNVGNVTGNDYAGGIVGHNYYGNMENNYYLADCATATTNVTTLGTTATAEEFASGHVAYSINYGADLPDGDVAFYQTIGSDTIPTLDSSHGIVMVSETEEGTYTSHIHNFSNGVCTICGKTETATWNPMANAYEIANAAQLYWFAELVNNGANYGYVNAILTADIVVNESVLDAEGNLNDNLEDNDFIEWLPIGTNENRFFGRFNGQGHTISGLYFYNTNSGMFPDGGGSIGLIGTAGNGATIENVGVVDSYINGGYIVGGIVGWLAGDNITITNCFNTSTIVAENEAGGIVGYGYSEYASRITNCFNTGKISGSNRIGSIAGYYEYRVEIDNCYYLAGSASVGDAVQNGIGIDNRYSSLSSRPDANGSTTAATAEQFGNGFVAGRINAKAGENIYYQTIGRDAEPTLDSSHGVVYTSLPCPVAFGNTPIVSEKAHKFENGICTVCGEHEQATWNAEANAFAIANAGQLYWFADYVNSGEYYYDEDHEPNAILTADIVVNSNLFDASGNISQEVYYNLYYSNSMIYWTPIGSGPAFVGIFDGQGHTISGLIGEGDGCVGLFGLTYDATIKNLGVIGSEFYARAYVGGIIGRAEGETEVINCFNTSYIYSDDEDESNAGGICGYISNGSSITNCYSTGTVNGGVYTGSIVGKNNGSVSNCYYLEGSASYWGSGVYGGVGTGEVPVEDPTIASAVEGFRSGAVAYALNGSSSDEEDVVWYQTLGTDATPTLDNTHGVVYASEPCPFNNAGVSHKEHEFVNGMCVCGLIDEPVFNEEANAYEIANAGHLYWFAELVNSGQYTSAPNAILTADIVVNKNVLDKNGKLNAGNFKEWTPIGIAANGGYTGRFDGQGHTISGLYYVNTSYTRNAYYPECGTNAGLFSAAGQGAMITNVGLVDSYIYGANNVGGILGYSDGLVAIINCYNTSTIVSDCYREVSYCGGICGYPQNCFIVNCYNTGTVNGFGAFVGAIASDYDGNEDINIVNCYYLKGCAIDGDRYVQNGIGINYSSRADMPFVTTAATAEQFASGYVAYMINQKADKNIYYQTIGEDVLPTLNSNHGVVYMSSPCTAIISNNPNDVSSEIQHEYENGFCTACGAFEEATWNEDDEVFEIANAGQLYWFAKYVNNGDLKYDDAVLTADIVVNENVLNEYGELNEDEADNFRAWIPIGTYNNQYSASFNGRGHTISGLYFNNATNNVGLFGTINDAEIDSVGIVDSYIYGNSNVGGICGYQFDSRIANCYNAGTILVGGGSNVAGISGYMEEALTINCYNIGNVGYFSKKVDAPIGSGVPIGIRVPETNAGGIVGYLESGDVYNCYNAGEVDGFMQYGGIYGENEDGSLNNNFVLEGTVPEYSNNSGTLTTAERFASGYVGYMLNRNDYNLRWYQNLFADELPTLNSSKNLVTGYIAEVQEAQVSGLYEVVGDVVLTTDYEVAKNKELYIDGGASLEITNGAKVTVKGQIIFGGGSIVYSGDTLTFGVGNPSAEVIGGGELPVVSLSKGIVKCSNDIVNGEITVEAVGNTGFHFVKWNDESTDAQRTFSLNASGEYYPEFDINVYEINVTANGDGTVDGAGSYRHGLTVTLTATAGDDSQFIRWSDGSTDNPYTFVANKDVTLEAVFAGQNAAIYTVSAEPNNESFGSVAGGSLYLADEVATLTATAAEHYHFVQWTDGDKTNPREVTITMDSSFVATFAVDTFNLSIIADHGEVVSGEGEHYWGESVDIQVAASEGYKFSHWADDNSTSRARTFTMQGDTTLTAVFEPKVYNIATTTIGNGTVEGAGYHAYDSQVTLTAIPATGHHFVKWNDGATDARHTITVAGAETFTAYFEINTYNVTVQTEHGHVEVVTGNTSVALNSEYDHGTELTFKAVADANYKFARWNATNYNSTMTVTLTSNLTLTPLFISSDDEIYTITVAATDGGSATSSGTSFLKNEKVTLTATPNNGYRFVQWSTGSTANPYEYTVTSTRKITAEFAINSYELKVLAGANGTVKGGGTFEFGTEAPISATAAEGYHFVRWSDGNTNAERTITVSENTTVTAEFAINTYAVKASAANGKVEGAGTYNHGAEATLTAVANTGYHFTKWSDGETAATRKVTITSELSFTAEFEINSYTVSVSGTNGTVEGAGTYTYGEKATISATAAEGYHFTQWSDGLTINPRSVIVTSELEFVAEFAINTFDVRVSATNGTIEGAGTYNYGAEATLTATANTGYHFSKWNDGVETATRKVTVKSDLSFTAEFAVNSYTISVDSAANGTVTGAGTYTYGATATLEAKANKGYHFVMWTDSVKTATRTVEVTGNASFSAVFAGNTYELAVKAKNGTVEGAGTYEHGAEATLTAEANAGYVFSKWDDGNTDNPRKVTVTGNKTYTATFKKASYAVTVNAKNGNITASSGTLQLGATITLTAVADSGYHFVMWSDSVLDNPRTVTLTAELLQQVTANGFEFTAIFEKDDNTAIADEAAEDVNIFAFGNTIVVENADSDIFVYTAMGRLIERVAAEAGRTEIQVNGSGVYIVKTGNTAKRVMIND